MSINKQIKKKNLAPDSVDGSKVKLLQDQSLKGINHLGQEVDLLKISQSGKSTTQGKEIALQEDLASEQAAREVADASEKLAREVADASEKLAREAADAVLTSAVSAEQSAREAADATESAARIAGDSSALQSSKNYTDDKISLIIANTDPAALDSLSELVSAFESADSDLNQSITSLASAASSNLASAESSIRSAFAAADAGLASDIETSANNVRSEFAAADAGLASSIDDLDGYAQDIRSDLDQEIIDRESAVSALAAADAGLASDIETSANNVRSEFAAADDAKLVEAKAYADQAQDNAEDYIDAQIALIPPVDLSNYYITSEVEELLDERVSKSGDVMSGALEIASEDEPDSKAYISPNFIGVVGLIDGEQAGPSAYIQPGKVEISNSRDATETEPNIASVITMGGGNLALSMNHREGSGPEYFSELNMDQVNISEVDWLNSSSKHFIAGPSSASWFSDTLGSSNPQPIMPQNPQDLVVKAYVDEAIDSIPAVDLSAYETTAAVDAKIAAQEAYSEEVADNALTASIEASKQYADANFALITDVASIEDSLQATQEELSQVSQDSANAVSAETTRAMASESALSSRIDSVISNTDPAFLDSLSELVSAFESADSSLSGSISALSSSASSALGEEIARATAAEAAEKARAEASESVLTAAVSSEAATRAAADSSEAATRAAADSALASSIDDLDGYAQDIRSDVDNLDGYAQDIRSDLDALQSAFDAQVDGPFYNKMKIEVSANLATVELAHEAIANSIVVSVGRLMVHKDEDFTVSVVGGVTHLTWIGDMASEGVEAIQSGDKVFVTYAY